MCPPYCLVVLCLLVRVWSNWTRGIGQEDHFQTCIRTSASYIRVCILPPLLTESIIIVALHIYSEGFLELWTLVYSDRELECKMAYASIAPLTKISVEQPYIMIVGNIHLTWYYDCNSINCCHVLTPAALTTCALISCLKRDFSVGTCMHESEAWNNSKLDRDI